MSRIFLHNAMPLVQTTEKHLARDTESKALVVTDEVELLRSRADRASRRRLVQQQHDVETRFKEIDERFDKYERLLMTVVSSIQELVNQNQQKKTADQL